MTHPHFYAVMTHRFLVARSHVTFLSTSTNMGRAAKRSQSSVHASEAAKKAKKANATTKRTKNHRTAASPFEAAVEDSYTVESVLSKEYRNGLPYYEVKWEGYEDTTFEPLCNLVDATSSVKEFETSLRAKENAALAQAKHQRKER